MLTWYEDTNGVYTHAGKPFIPSYSRAIEWKDAELIQSWDIDPVLNVLTITVNTDLDADRGDQLIIHCPKNPYVRGVGGTYYVIEFDVTDDGFEYTLRKHACSPIANYNLTMARVQKKVREYYATHDMARGIWVRRSNGAPFSQRRGRRSGKC